MLLNLIKSRWGIFMLSFIIGFGVVTLFRKDCQDANCFSFVAPRPSDLNNNIYKFGDACYEFQQSPQECTGETLIYPDKITRN